MEKYLFPLVVEGRRVECEKINCLKSYETRDI